MIDFIHVLIDLLLNNLPMGIVLIVLGAIEAIKRSERISSKDLPLVAGIVGLFIGLSMSVCQTEILITQAGQIGLISGLASCGVFDFFKMENRK